MLSLDWPWSALTSADVFSLQCFNLPSILGPQEALPTTLRTVPHVRQRSPLIKPVQGSIVLINYPRRNSSSQHHQQQHPLDVINIHYEELRTFRSKADKRAGVPHQELSELAVHRQRWWYKRRSDWEGARQAAPRLHWRRHFRWK